MINGKLTTMIVNKRQNIYGFLFWIKSWKNEEIGTIANVDLGDKKCIVIINVIFLHDPKGRGKKLKSQFFDG